MTYLYAHYDGIAIVELAVVQYRGTRMKAFLLICTRHFNKHRHICIPRAHICIHSCLSHLNIYSKWYTTGCPKSLFLKFHELKLFIKTYAYENECSNNQDISLGMRESLICHGCPHLGI